MTKVRHYQAAIVGAGFCGTMVAVHLVRLMPYISVALIERSPVAGPGLAYGTQDPGHLLNVRASQMGAFADDPQHFWHWIEGQSPSSGLSPQSFMPRMIFGNYLKHILSECRAAHPKLDIVNRNISNIRHLPKGGFELTGSDGETLTADHVVLALGNFPPDQPFNSAPAMNPYAPETWQTLADDGDVLIVGTGLTSLDLVATLAKTKPKGTLHLLSRHGLLPREHTDTPAYTLKLKPPYPDTALGLLRAIRKEIGDAPDVPWQSVIDALRPLNQQLWQSLDHDEQRRFLRHLRPYWEVHRHRCPPEVMDIYRALKQEGRIALHHGSIVKQTPHAKGWDIVWRPRGKTNPENLTVRHVVRCTGPQADLGKLEDGLVQSLMKNNLIAPDSLRLGIASTGNYLVCDAKGDRVEGLYALGSLLKGRLYESAAVPELRRQVVDVAGLIAYAMKDAKLFA